MNVAEYEIMYQVENYHWWYLGMAKITKAILDRWYSSQSNLRILDAGCGTGIAMQTYLADYGKVIGFDVSSKALHYCQKRGIHRLVQASIIQIPLPNKASI
jgi:ubiquinone/menaquinone biosynthesis C-methylase UbiE